MDLHEVIAELGMYWPRGSPGQLHQAACAYRRAAADIAAIQAASRSSVSAVRAHNQGPPIEGFAASWARWQTDRGNLAAAIRACNQLADACDAYAREIEKARHRIIELAAAAAALGAGTGRHRAQLGRHAHAILAALVAASWAERTALSAAVERALVAAGLVTAGPVGAPGMAAGGRPGAARSIAWAAVGRSVAPLPVAAGLAAAGATQPWRGPAMGLHPPPGVHRTPSTRHLLPFPTRSGGSWMPAGGAVAAGIHLLTAAHVDGTEVLVGAFASAAGAAGGAVAGSVGAARATERARGVPDWIKRVRPPSQRHQASSVIESTWWKDANSVVSPSVDVQGDVDAIRSGQATYQDHELLDGQFLLPNGRVYGVEGLPDGTRMLYPVSGPGIDTLTRTRMKALGVYNRLGDTPRAAATLEGNVNAEPADRQAALQVSSAVQDSPP